MSTTKERIPVTLSRYIFIECLIYFGITLLAFTGVILTARMIKFADLVINKGVEASQIGTVFIALIPTFMEIAIPLATLLGIMLAIARLSGDSEIVVMRGSGISVYQLLIPIVVFGALSAITSLWIAQIARPYGFSVLNQTLFEIAKNRSSANLDPGVFNDMGKMTLYAEQIDGKNGLFNNLIIDDRRDPTVRKIVFSERGRIVSNPAERTIGIFLEDGEIHETNRSGHYGLTKFRENTLAFDTDELNDPDSSRRNKSTRELYMGELRQEIRRLKRARDLSSSLSQGEVKARLTLLPIVASEQNDETPPTTGKGDQSRNLGSLATIGMQGPTDDPVLNESPNKINRMYARARIERAMRYAMPLAAFILAIIALPLGIQPPRAQKTWGPALSVMLGLGVFVLYYGVLTIATTLAEGGKLSPELSVWLPNVMGLAIAYYCIRNTASEKWQSIAHGLEMLFARWAKQIKPVFQKFAALRSKQTTGA